MRLCDVTCSRSAWLDSVPWQTVYLKGRRLVRDSIEGFCMTKRMSNEKCKCIHSGNGLVCRGLYVQNGFCLRCSALLWERIEGPGQGSTLDYSVTFVSNLLY